MNHLSYILVALLFFCSACLSVDETQGPNIIYHINFDDNFDKWNVFTSNHHINDSQELQMSWEKAETNDGGAFKLRQTLPKGTHVHFIYPLSKWENALKIDANRQFFITTNLKMENNIQTLGSATKGQVSIYWSVSQDQMRPELVKDTVKTNPTYLPLNNSPVLQPMGPLLFQADVDSPATTQEFNSIHRHLVHFPETTDQPVYVGLHMIIEADSVQVSNIFHQLNLSLSPMNR
ncbi:hypothetical protein [Persicobacter psychrovividus]|uniref:Uncharacterized protein n=1 Tax=Persicobacter psychrovividus TaxID=387638 RepID=A0ABM7VIA8_9BACT|nr:hypothetical protein PEPS_29930 [Persicobacter psychrovividus]